MSLVPAAMPFALGLRASSNLDVCYKNFTLGFEELAARAFSKFFMGLSVGVAGKGDAQSDSLGR